MGCCFGCCFDCCITCRDNNCCNNCCNNCSCCYNCLWRFEIYNCLTKCAPGENNICRIFDEQEIIVG